MHAATPGLELDLRKALLNGEFTVLYQPPINLRTGKITTCEALIRWQQAERGVVPPLSFIPIAEETGLIVPIGQWVLHRACLDAMEWPRAIPGHRQRVAGGVQERQFLRDCCRRSGTVATTAAPARARDHGTGAHAGQ